MKFAVLFAALISMFTLSSCFGDSDSSQTYDVYTTVTLKSNYGEYYFISDDGIVYKPQSTSILSGIQLTDGTYLNRFVAAIKFVDGQSLSSSTKSYNISKIGVYSQLVYKSMTTQSDTIKGDYGIADVPSNIWAVNGYINVPLKYYYSSTTSLSASQFNLYTTGVDQDTLFVTLQQSRKIETNESVSSAQLFSFSIPFSSPGFGEYGQLVPKNDSIVIKLSAKGYDKATPFVKTTKYKYSQR